MTDTLDVLKLVIIGDGMVGKTALLHRYQKKNQLYIDDGGTYFGNSVKNMEHPEKPGQYLNLHLWDTGGRDENYVHRKICYPNTDVVLLCFSVVDPTCVVNVKSVWIQETRLHLKGIPIILVGTKVDLRQDNKTIETLWNKDEEPVSTESGRILAKEIGAVDYIEVSSLTSFASVELVFKTAVRAALRRTSR